MTDLYFIVEYTDGEETWRSIGYAERRLAERLGRMKERRNEGPYGNPNKIYRIELRQPKNAPKY